MVAGGPLSFPAELIKREGMSAAELSDQIKAQNAFLREHGVNPGDWPATRAVREASTGHVPSLERARRLRATS